MRAITVPVNASTGVAGFVFPGDHVDLMLTQDVEGGGDGPALKVTETIVRNVRVLATDQRIDNKDKDGKMQVKTFANVTFEVTPRIAEKIAVAQSLGTLSLSLRSIADNGSPSWSVRLPPATSRSPPVPTRLRRSRCCWRSPIVRSTTTPPSHGWGRVALPAPLGPVPVRRPGRKRPGSAGPEVEQPLRQVRAVSASLAATVSPSFRWELAK